MVDHKFMTAANPFCEFVWMLWIEGAARGIVNPALALDGGENVVWTVPACSAPMNPIVPATVPVWNPIGPSTEFALKRACNEFAAIVNPV